MCYEIEKGVPIPDLADKRLKYPFSKMGVGDSFTTDVPPDTSVKIWRNNMYCTSNAWGKRNGGLRFHVEIEGDKIRVWRIK